MDRVEIKEDEIPFLPQDQEKEHMGKWINAKEFKPSTLSYCYWGIVEMIQNENTFYREKGEKYQIYAPVYYNDLADRWQFSDQDLRGKDWITVLYWMPVPPKSI